MTDDENLRFSHWSKGLLIAISVWFYRHCISYIFYKTDFNKWFGKLHSTVFYFDLLSLMLVYVAHAMLQKIKINKNCSQERAVEFRHWIGS